MKKLLATMFIGLSLFILPLTVQAQGSLSDSVGGQLKAGGAKAGFDTKKNKPPQVIIAEIIQIALSGIGIIFTILIIRAGYWFITANGEQDKIEKAKTTMQGAIIGLGIVLAAYSITNFVAKRMQNITTGQDVYKVENNSFPTNGF
jgi:hypothetical protein